jgi:hypothetical protein
MKKKGLFLTIVSAALLAAAGTAVAFAVWGGVWKTETNTVKIGQPVQVSIDGDVFDVDDILPNGETSATFAIDLTDADFTKNTYKLAIVDVDFDEDLTYGDGVPVWTYKFGDGGGGFAALEEDVSFALIEGELLEKKTSVKLTLKLDAGIPVEYAGGELTFVLKIVETEKVL